MTGLGGQQIMLQGVQQGPQMLQIQGQDGQIQHVSSKYNICLTNCNFQQNYCCTYKNIINGQGQFSRWIIGLC